jgi:hypothetical protein
MRRTTILARRERAVLARLVSGHFRNATLRVAVPGETDCAPLTPEDGLRVGEGGGVGAAMS